MAQRTRAVEGDTRRRVMSLMLKHGPITASALAQLTGISAAGVRRHLDKLVDNDLAQPCEPRAVAGEETSRGRPAQHFELTNSGRAQFGSAYDTLAIEAVDAIKELGGPAAVKDFARKRVGRILEEVTPVGDHPSAAEVEEVVNNLALELEKHGYAATVNRAGNGIQICQHHCPVSEVAVAHPEICEAELEAISALVGRHTQPLASIKDGNGVCTTNIPLAASRIVASQLSERSGDS